VNLVSLVLIGAFAAYLAFIEYLDWQGRMEVLEAKHPLLSKAVNARPFRLVLLFLIFGMLAANVREHTLGRDATVLNAQRDIRSMLTKLSEKGAIYGKSGERSRERQRISNAHTQHHPTALRRDRLILVAMPVSGVVNGCRLCLLPPKVHHRTPDSQVPDLLCDPLKQQVARVLQRATQMQQLGGVSILAPLSGSLN